jgi:DNA-binding MarR family transcriptional regulator
MTTRAGKAGFEELDKNELAVLARLLILQADTEDGQAEFSFNSLQESTGLDNSSLANALNKLTDAGLINIPCSVCGKTLRYGILPDSLQGD